MRGWRRRGGRWARRGAALALALSVLVLAGGGGGEELLAAALAAWGGVPEEGGGADGASWGGFAGGANAANEGGGGSAAAFAAPGGPPIPPKAPQVLPGPPQILSGASPNVPGAPQILPGAPLIVPGAPPNQLNAPPILRGPPEILAGPLLEVPPLLLSPPPCGHPPPFLLVLVPSAPSHFARRQAIRETWGGWRGEGGVNATARTLFVLGVPGEGSPEEKAALGAEASRHGDLVQGAFADAYANLTRKTLLLLGWAAARCARAPFVLKADDDVFVNLPALTSYLAALGRPNRLYLGRVHWWVRPERDPRGRHHVPAALYPPAAFPPYCSGTAYVLSRDAVTAVLAAAPRVPLVAPEDVWVGLCARRAGLRPRHSARMAGSARFPLDACCYREVLLSAHRLGPAELRRAWALLLPPSASSASSPRGEGGCGAWQRALGLLRCRVLAASQALWH